MATRMTITGVEAASRMVKTVADSVAKDMKGGVDKTAAETLAVAVSYCPLDTGALRASARVESETAGHFIEARIRFGDAKAYYAIYVHEINKNYRVGGWKYLERAVRDVAARKLNENIIQSIQAGLKGTGAFTTRRVI
jgi:hypothetical protein